MMGHAECALQKCAYGPKQSRMESYLRLSNFLKSIGLEIYPKEPDLLVKDEVLLFIYVDDIHFILKQSRSMKDFEIA